MTEKKEEILEFLVSTLKETKDFVLEQAPDVVQQYLGALFIHSFSSAMVSFVGFIILITMTLIIFIKKPFRMDDDSFPSILTCVFLFAMSVTCLHASIEKSIDAAKIHYYPKGYLLEQVLK